MLSILIDFGLRLALVILLLQLASLHRPLNPLTHDELLLSRSDIFAAWLESDCVSRRLFKGGQLSFNL